MKNCAACKLILSFVYFGKNRKTKDGYNNYCLPCARHKARTKRAVIGSIRCHMCDLSTKQVNTLMTKHYRQHVSGSYSKEHYKRDLLIANGRPPKVCPICSNETLIARGDKEYPKYHKACYSKWLSEFCQTEDFKAKRIAGLVRNGTNKRSHKEAKAFNIVKGICPDAVATYLLNWYSFDMFVPSTRTLIEFDGTYWHSRSNAIRIDKSKNTFIARHHPSLRLIRIAEKDWDRAVDKESFIRATLL